jgi:5-formyltetrahydrofolate cyclo-ligase
MGGHDTKRLLREAARSHRRRLGADWLASTSARVCAHALALPATASARRLVAYCPTNGEVDPAGIVEVVRARGIPVYLPRFVGDALTFVPEGPLRPGRYGIREPPAGEPLRDAGPETVALVPGLAFDLAGTRLGRGGGHYDRALAAWPGVATIGLAFECQLVPRLPCDPWDVPVSAIATESRVVPGGARSDVSCT